MRAATLEAFARAFAPFGFNNAALAPSYGLAEAVLAVTVRRTHTLDLGRHEGDDEPDQGVSPFLLVVEAHTQGPDGRVGDPLGGQTFTEYAYCFKCLPALDRGKALEFDPLLVRLEWHHTLTTVRRMTGEVVLRESMFDPVADLPVRRIVAMTYEEGRTRSSGKVLHSVPAASLLPFLHQRYDDVVPMLVSLGGAEAAAHA